MQNAVDRQKSKLLLKTQLVYRRLARSRIHRNHNVAQMGSLPRNRWGRGSIGGAVTQSKGQYVRRLVVASILQV